MNTLKELLNIVDCYSASVSAISALISAFATIILVVATILYVYLTRGLLSEGKLTRKALIAPSLSIYIEPNKQWANNMDIVIANNGAGVAFDITFEIEPDIKLFRNGQRLSDYNIFQKIEYLAPNQTIRFFVDSAPLLFENPNLKPFSINATYYNKDKDKFEVNFNMNFLRFDKLRFLDNDPLSRLYDALENINKAIKSIRT